MSPTWRPETPLVLPALGLRGCLRAAARGLSLIAVLGVGLLLLLAVRLVERPLHRHRRPWTPWITVWACRASLRLVGLPVEVVGSWASASGVIVANHSSWLDVLVINAVRPVTFVAKAEVSGWAGIGWLARATGTVFVRREARSEAALQVALIGARVARGEAVVLFPEGTSTDGLHVRPFKPTLLAAVPRDGDVQPLTLRWLAPDGCDPRFYGWFGNEPFGPHAVAVLALGRPGRVSLIWHAPLAAEGRTRKELAAEAEALVRAGLSPAPHPAP